MTASTPTPAQRSPYRDRLVGVSYSNDRLFLLHFPDGSVRAITEYNDELTGWEPELEEKWPTIFCFAGNAYYICGWWAEANNVTVEKLEDRR